MKHLYELYLKRNIRRSVEWRQVFQNWMQQKSHIIKLYTHFCEIYDLDYKFQERELHAWHVSCNEFWTNAPNPEKDRKTIAKLYEEGLLNVNSQANTLWNCFRNSYNANSKGIDGKIRILLIIAENFTYKEIIEQLEVSPNSVSMARKHSRINGPAGCPALEKPIIVRSKMSEVKEKEFQLFFADKANVNMSSYKMDAKTQMPVLYLKDQKSALWEKFSAIYPNGIKRISFMSCLQNSRFKYREDLGGLCITCNDYGYQPFENLIELVTINFSNKIQRDQLIHKLECLHHHLKRNYERELFVNEDGTADHVDCINHCLLFAFRECMHQHVSRCQECDEIFTLFKDLTNRLDPIHHPKLLEYQEQLVCYLAHQTRKAYLNAQFNSTLRELDNYGAIIVVDYKMRILPATSRETKSEFFGKRGWTLHTTLVFQKNKNNYEELDVQAYDHWSADTKQDAWFTASCFESVFTTMDPKPLWIKIISDNGEHYHNSELMTIISHWYDWYNIEIEHAIKRYIRVGCDLTERENIETALQDLSGTSVSHIEPN
ncbi:uncharacterized protein OCT59_021551 [Rhizophagus irregularis]|uniref:uncharacterized protein n=1 Tax=Rhizophagus irregularis TaxID=588596 RepID=UPI00332EC254|nr:hypothetical protein OCT59_021551 [Rhizophagus irregularis]